MDFHSSKENIQPLRGGRNVSQLNMALQAQGDADTQNELLRQKEQFENAIRNYTGEDPLQNWFQYILWVEQVFPKHGNLVNLLEDCISKFEYDKKYSDDRRLLKLIIKYIDIQPNPLELYQILHAHGFCRGVADLYRAWAYYHEVIGDYRGAEAVFQIGRRELAQPFNDLDAAYRSFIFAAGLQVVSGLNESRLLERRIALTSLQTYKPGNVGSVRIPNGQLPVLPVSQIPSKSNVVIPVYQDGTTEDVGEAAAMLPSIVSVARRQDHKENLLQPGVWTQVSQNSYLHEHSVTPFQVHEDNQSDFAQQGLKLPEKFFPISSETYANWILEIFLKEPYDPSKISMYPKSLVYDETPSTEFSIEEIKARPYLDKHREKAEGNATESVFTIRNSPLNDINNENIIVAKEGIVSEGANHEEQQSIHQVQQPIHQVQQQPLHPVQQQPLHPVQHQPIHQVQQHPVQHQPLHPVQQQPLHPVQHQPIHPIQQHSPIMVMNDSLHNSIHEVEAVDEHQHYESPNKNLYHTLQTVSSPHTAQQSFAAVQQSPFSFYQDDVGQSDQNPIPEQQMLQNNFMVHNYQFPSNSMHQENHYYQHNPALAHQEHQGIIANLPNVSLQQGDCYDMSLHKIASPADAVNEPNHILRDMFSGASERCPAYGLYQDVSTIQHPTALKTPLKDISADDLAETGSRGGLENAAAAQPCDEAKRISIFEDETNSYILPNSFPHNETINTQAFCFNLNNMKASTPNKILIKDTLSTIIEESKGRSYSSDDCERSYNPNVFPQTCKKTLPRISEENNYDYNLAQNRKANEELRTSLQEFMDYESNPSSPSTESPSPPVIIAPLDVVPTNPFKPAFISKLLERVGFPGEHKFGYHPIYTIPKLNVKKEIVCIGSDKYFIEKHIGKGAYGSVFKATNISKSQNVALKLQKPPNKWEYYICRELQARLACHPLKERFMDISAGYFCDQGSIIVSQFSPNGSLLCLANTMKQKYGRTMKESLCVFFCIEMLKIVDAMHEVKIIHADIKPDNFLVFLKDRKVQLQLIDFGCSIDMSLLPENASFIRSVTTDNFICCEMLDGRPWNYHTDLYCVGATAHVLLFDKYITVQKMDNHWSLTQKFTRYWNVPLWTEFFSCLLNQQDGAANNKRLQILLEDNLNSMSDFQNDLRGVTNILKNR